MQTREGEVAWGSAGPVGFEWTRRVWLVCFRNAVRVIDCIHFEFGVDRDAEVDALHDAKKEGYGIRTHARNLSR